MVAKLSQEIMKNARTSGNYGEIWQNTGKCVFCDLKDKYVLYEENGIVLVISLYAYIDGHMMAIPRRHVRSTKELTEREWETFRKLTYVAKKIIKQTYGHKGMWAVIKHGLEAQATVSDHLHMHFIPFDTTDLCKWNYRELKYTPLENVENYKREKQTFIKTLQKFEDKYCAHQLLPVVCDLVLVNRQKKTLFCERADDYKLDPDYLTFPGGHVDNSKFGLLGSLQKEIKEELNYELDTSKVSLVDSQISSIAHLMKHNLGDIKIPRKSTFIWNVYKLTNFADEDKLKPGDDTKSFVWLSAKEVSDNPRISEESKKLVAKVLEN